MEDIRDAIDFLHRSSVALVLSDAMQPDHPLIYANPAFEALTGYANKDVQDRNCRFLQDGHANEEARETLRDALEGGRSTQVVLRNRTRGGFDFDNLLFIEPLRTGRGEIKYFVGSQFDVTRLVDIERRTSAHAGTLQQELDRLQQVNRLLIHENHGHLARSASQVVQQWMRRAESRR
ncbi:PAS domain-containing protein [Citreimonas salinaria]|uniref:PAS domain S-box-containing protein n=1 Tax=Citreimonas salinaria TaxID=321339 RepID=A0A1H3ILR3_9RHOB|nr:PAS domain-containing protein [Citreimonas salinaria]SDY28295.1 PAS domain S-box-containing protein [Citreimonas salinaria]